jgi:hypothetical protein
MPIEPLYRLLLSAFSPESFAAFLLDVDDGRALVHELPALTCPPQTFFLRAATLLDQHGLLGADLFEKLLRHRPHRRGEILDVAAATGVRLRAPAAPPRPPRPPRRADEPREAALEPTLAAWCCWHWRPLAALCCAPLLAAAAVAACAPLADPLRGTYLALHVGQATFSAAALLCFATWRTPDASWLFRGSGTYTEMWRKLAELEADAGAGDPAVRAAAGADPRSRDSLSRWLDAAIEARDQSRRAWLLLWSTWTCLYAVAVWDTVTRASTPHTVALLRALLTLLNNAATAAIFVAFWVLTYVTVPLEPTRRDLARPGGPAAWLVALVAVLVYAVVQVVTVFDAIGGSADAGAARTASALFDLGSGMAAAVVIAMFVGRLDSAFIAPGRLVLVALYLYAAIQPSWSILSLLTHTHLAAPMMEPAVFAIAWAAKVVLFALFAWMFHTGRLDFQSLRSRRLLDGVAADWRALTG